MICDSCEHVLYQDPRDVCKKCQAMKNGQPNNYKKGDPFKARLDAERKGLINIVIGGEGEFEVNAKWGIHEAYVRLAQTAENCGGLITKAGQNLIEAALPHGLFELEWMDAPTNEPPPAPMYVPRLAFIRRVDKRAIWEDR